MNSMPSIPDQPAPAATPTVAEQAVAADEQRIGSELVDTVIRDLFGVGLTLQSALPHVSGVAEERLNAAIDGIDAIILTIRELVFGLATVDDDGRGKSGPGSSSKSA
jgi:signal transduction histidine kinase